MRAYGIKNAQDGLVEFNLPEKHPDPDEVLLHHTAIGVNFFDYAYTEGIYATEHLNLPQVMGFEGCGIIEAVGSNIKDFQVGEKVAYAISDYGAFCERRTLGTRWLIRVPSLPNLTDEIVAGMMTKGLLARALAYRVINTSMMTNAVVLIYNPAGGVGHLLVQLIAQNPEITIYGAVGHDEKKEFALKMGCKAVINYHQHNVVDFIREQTNSMGVDIVYDPLGQNTFMDSLNCLGYGGLMVSYGDVTGQIHSFDINLLNQRSLFLTRPYLSVYLANKAEYVLSSEELFSAASKGTIKPYITTLPFSDLPKAIASYAHQKNMGSMVVSFQHQ